MAITACDELGRATRCYVSAFGRDRVHESRITRGEVRCLVADFNGALPKGRTIASAVWRCVEGFPVVMANARISGRSTAVDISAQMPGCSAFRCEATMDNGEVYAQRFVVNVTRGWWYWFEGEGQITQGPKELRVSV